MATVLAVSLIAAGCGGDNRATTAGGPGAGGGATTQAEGASLSKSEWIAKATAVCKVRQGELTAAAQKAFPNGQASAADQEKFALETLVPIAEKLPAELRAIPPPARQEAAAKTYIDTVEQEVAAVKADPSLITGGFNAKSKRLAKQLGLSGC